MNTNFTKKAISLLLAVVMLCTCMPAIVPVLASSGFAGGSGTADAPYIVKTPEQLDAVRTILNGHFKLGGNIDLTQYLATGDGYTRWNTSGWLPISDADHKFSGSFDGGNYKITGLWINRGDMDFVGLFGYGKDAVFKNLAIELNNAKGGVRGNIRVGALAGEVTRGLVENCSVSGNIAASGFAGGLLGGMEGGGTVRSCSVSGSVAGGAQSGGLIGQLGGLSIQSVVTNCHATSDVSGTEYYTGGLVGYMVNSIVDQCYATGSVTGVNATGGLAGHTRSGGKITNSYASGTVVGSDTQAGGLVGSNYGDLIQNCYATGGVTAVNGQAGGLAGYMRSGETVTDCYATGDAAGGNETGGLVGALNTDITNCYATGKVIGTGDFSGGLAGIAAGCTVSFCYASGAVRGGTRPSYITGTGGLIGNLSSAEAENCFASGTVMAVSKYAGGLVGYVSHADSAISNCYAVGAVSGISSVGGLAGRNDGGINSSYATGKTTDTSNASGGLVGANYGTAANCYFDKQTTGIPAGSAGITPLTTAEMIHSTTLTGTMAGLGTANWKKRANDTACYYPELSVFYEGTAQRQAQSKTSVTVAKRQILLTAGAVTYGQSLNGIACTGTDAFDSATAVAGAAVWNNGTTVPTVKNSGYSATFTPQSQLYTVTTATVAVTVTPREVLVTPDGNIRKDYTAADPEFTYTYTPQLLSGNYFTGALSRQPGENAGDYTYTLGTLSAGDNYKLTLSAGGVFTISKAKPKVMLEAQQISENSYRNVKLKVSVTGAAGGAVPTGTVTLQDGAAGLQAVPLGQDGTGEVITTLETGLHDIAAVYSGDTNYRTANGSVSEFRVRSAQSALYIHNEKNSITYGDAPFYLTAEGGSTSGGITWESDDETIITVGTNGKVTVNGAGVVKVTATKAGDADYYDKTAVLYLAVNKKALTITAADTQKIYGEENPEFTLGYSGFVNGDTADSLAQPPLAVTAADKNSAVGTYKITPSGGSDDNYTFLPRNGDLTITKRTLTVTADAKTKEYGQEDPEFTFRYSGFANGNTERNLDEVPVISTTAGANPKPGTYKIQLTGGKDNNYTLQLQDEDFTVTKRTLTVTAEHKTITYGDTLPELTFAYSGFLEGDTESSLDVPPVISSLEETPGAGTHSITLSGGSDSLYRFAYQHGVLTVHKAVLTVTADDKTKNFGEEDPELTFRYSGFVNGDTEAVITEPPAITVTAETGAVPGMYDIILSGGKAENYSFVYINGVLTINGEQPGTVYGDVDLDGDVTIKDVTLLQQYLVSAADLNDQQRRNASVLMEDVININNATMIQKYLVELISRFPAEDSGP